MKNIIIDIDSIGKATIEVNGVTGPGCTEITKQLEAVLGVDADRTLKPEHVQEIHQKQQAKTNQ